MSTEPLIDFSSASTRYSEGVPEQDNLDAPASWRPARVVLAELTNQIYGLVVFPVFDCGFTSFPPVPLVEVLIPDPLVFIGSQEESRIITFTRSKINHPIPSEFRLYFNETAEFWDVMDVLSHLRSQQEKRLANLITRLIEVRATVPTHSADPAQDAWCSDPAHNNAGDVASPPSSPATSGSPTITGSPPIIGSPLTTRPSTPSSV